MNNYFLLLTISALLLISSSQTMAQTSPYFAHGEDVDNILNNDEASTFAQLEEKILEFPIIREVYRQLLNINIINLEMTEENREDDADDYVSESDGC